MEAGWQGRESGREGERGERRQGWLPWTNNGQKFFDSKMKINTCFFFHKLRTQHAFLPTDDFLSFGINLFFVPDIAFLNISSLTIKRHEFQGFLSHNP